jgi:DNA-binding response OmpR family regulator
MELSKTNLPAENFSSTITKNILLIEDDRVVAKMLEHILKRRGYEVQICSDGNAALEKFKEIEPSDLILLDIVLPHIDGFELLNKIRHEEGWENVPVIMVTANTQELSVVRAFEVGANDYIKKPIQLEELIVRVNRLLR